LSEGGVGFLLRDVSGEVLTACIIEAYLDSSLKKFREVLFDIFTLLLE
jgi:hypothetical protein